MPLTAGIVGLPNVGKSTLFNAITHSQVEAANYPFATIQPNVGTVEVPDKRLDKLKEMVHPKKNVPTTFEFTDIAGLVKGASKGEGLGNQFLANIRETDAIIQVVRCFDDPNTIHVAGKVNPLDDIETINTELALADMASLEKRIAKSSKIANSGDKQAKVEVKVMQTLYDKLSEASFINVEELFDDEEELKIAKQSQLMCIKPVIYAANVSEFDVVKGNEYTKVVQEYANQHGAEMVIISAKIEEELAELSQEEAKEYLAEIGIENSGIEKMIQAVYHLLNLRTYITAGEIEVRAWTITAGTKAPQAAGVIHTDFEKGFIRAEVISYEDFLNCNGSYTTAKEKGLMRLEGKDYVVQDGDIMHFRFAN